MRELWVFYLAAELRLRVLLLSKSSVAKTENALELRIYFINKILAYWPGQSLS